MIKIEQLETVGWKQAVRGMRNPKNSWSKSDSAFLDYDDKYYDILGNPIEDEHVNDFKFNMVILGKNDERLISKLCKGGSVHAKFRRMIKVYCDITAPLYWWKEFDTYKIGTVANSCSTMHTLCDKPFELSDFSCGHLVSWDEIDMEQYCVYKDNNINASQYDFDLKNIPAIEGPTEGLFHASHGILFMTIRMLNKLRELWLKSDKKDKSIWYQMIQLLPSSYNQKRTVELNYEVLAGIYRDRKNHKLSEWVDLCSFMKDNLPYSWIFTGEYELRNLVNGVDRSNGATDASMTEDFTNNFMKIQEACRETTNNFMKIQEAYRKAHKERYPWE